MQTSIESCLDLSWEDEYNGKIQVQWRNSMGVMDRNFDEEQFGAYLLERLNNIGIDDTGFLIYPFKKELYQKRCKIEFSGHIYGHTYFKIGFLKMFLTGKILFTDSQKTKEFDNSTEDSEILSLLKAGELKISEYGRAWLDTSRTRNGISTWAKEMDKEKKELDIFKNTMYVQVLTLMGIIVAVIAFINLSTKVFENPEYFKLCFLQQLLVSCSLYLPLLFIILIVMAGLFIFYKIFNLFTKSVK